MTKKHHPNSRAERLKLKQENGTVQYTKPTHAKKRRKEELKDWETKDELARASRLHEYESD